MNMKLRPPAPGSELWYVPHASKPTGPTHQPMALERFGHAPAVVTRVHTDRLVDLEVTDDAGVAHRVPCVSLVHDGDPNPDALVGHCQWTKPGSQIAAPLTEREKLSIAAGDVGDATQVLGRRSGKDAARKA